MLLDILDGLSRPWKLSLRMSFAHALPVRGALFLDGKMSDSFTKTAGSFIIDGFAFGGPFCSMYIARRL